MEQFRRSYQLLIGLEAQAIRIEDLDIEFEVIKSLSGDPNISEITIMGLGNKTQQSIIKQKNPPVALFAGYEQKKGLIFKGDARDCWSEHIGTESLTHINSGDAERNLRTKRINKTFKAGTPVLTVLASIVKTLEIMPGNLGSTESPLTLLDGSRTYVNGVTISGAASTALKNVCKSCGVNHSVQNNVLQILGPVESLPEQPIILLKENLIGSPEIGSDDTTKLTTLLDSDIKPGRLISDGKNLLRVHRARYYGKSAPAQNWYTEIEGKKVA